MCRTGMSNKQPADPLEKSAWPLLLPNVTVLYLKFKLDQQFYFRYETAIENGPHKPYKFATC